MKLYRYDKEKMDFVPTVKHVYYSLLALAIVLVSSRVYDYVFLKEKLNSIEYISEETKTLIINENNQFSEDKLKEFILSLNIRFPHIVFAQAKLESGSFKSKIFRENHNFFGMKVAKRRPTTNKGEQNGHAYFDSWKDCVVDYAFYQAAYLNDLRSESEYLQYLKQNYAEDPKYVDKLLKIIKR